MLPAYSLGQEGPLPLFGDTLQAKLAVGQPDDPYEREADAVAQRVLSDDASGPPGITSLGPRRAARPMDEEVEGDEGEAQRMCAECAEERPEEEEEEEPPEQQPVQRMCSSCEETLHRKADGAGEAAGGGEGAAQGSGAGVNVPRGGGQPLPAPVRTFFEPRLGRDLSGVRLHAGVQAAEAARALKARAYTVGQEIGFAAGQYAPEIQAGRHLLAHELTHTIQQRGSNPAGRVDRAASEGEDFTPDDREDDDDALGRGPATAGLVQRQGEECPPGDAEQATRAGTVAARVHDELTGRPGPAARGFLGAAAVGAGILSSVVLPGGGLGLPGRASAAVEAMTSGAGAIEALAGHGEPTRCLIKQEFHERYRESIQNFLKNHLVGDDLVRAFALLNSNNYHEYHTAMALALIPSQTRDEEVNRILYALPLTGRQVMERHYNESFAEIGEGSLKNDIKGDLEGWRRQKALALLHRDLTSADELYFDSVGIEGTNNEAVIRRIQAEWTRGPQSFYSFERDWNRYVRNQAHWTEANETWTRMSLREAMQDEFSNDFTSESWHLVRAVLDGFEAYQRNVGVEIGPLTSEQQTERERIEIEAAERTLVVAGEGAGTNNAQLFHAVSELQRLWEQRIEGARRAGDQRLAEQYRRQWDERRRRLISTDIPEEMDPGTHDYQRARLLTLGHLTPADEVYLAKEERNHGEVIRLVTESWARGQVDQLRAEALQPRREPSSDGRPGEVVRPEYYIDFAISVAQGIAARRILTLTNTDYGNANRGAERLSLELDEGNSDSDLRRGYELLRTNGISRELRQEVVEAFAARYLRNAAGDNATQKFLGYISRRYKDSTTVWEFRDLLAETSNPEEMVRRAQGRWRASRTGILDPVLSDFIRSYDLVTGEDTEAVALESLQRLQFIARQAGASDDELAVMMAERGVTNPAELARMEYRDFVSRLEELRELKRSITEAIATAVEIAVEAAITVATGGAAAGALLASLAAAVAGMVTRELARGQDYDLMSRENAQQLALIIASHGLGAVSRNLFSDVLSAERLERMGRAGHFLHGAATEGFTQVQVQVLAMGFEENCPTGQEIGARAVTILGNSLGAGRGAMVRHRITENTPAIARLRTTIVAHVQHNLISAIGEETGEVIRTGPDAMNGAELGRRFVQRSANAVGRGVVGGLGEFGGHEVTAARERRRAAGAPGGEEAPPPEAIPDPSRVGVGMGREATEGDVEIRLVVPVGTGHNLSVVRRPGRGAFVILCSPNCGRLRLLLNGLREQHGPRLSADDHESINTHLQAVDDIERRLAANPDDAEAQRQMNTLAEQVNTLMRSVGEPLLFGVTPDAEGAAAPEGPERPAAVEGPAGAERPAAPAAPGEDLPRMPTPAERVTLARRTAEANTAAARGLQKLENTIARSVRSFERILASIPSEHMSLFLRAINDPAFGFVPEFVQFYETLGNNITALNFVLAHGGETFFTMVRFQGTAGSADNLLRVTPDLQRAAAALDNAGSQADVLRRQLERLSRRSPSARRESQLDQLLGGPRPRTTEAPPIATPDRSDPRYNEWLRHLAAAQRFARDHPNFPVNNRQLAVRASLLHILARARSGEFTALSPESRIALLDEFDALGRSQTGAGMEHSWVNNYRGALAEALFAEGTGTKMAFIGGQRQGRLTETGASIPDYSIPPATPANHTRPREWVEIKSNVIDSVASGEAIARFHLREDVRAYRRNLPTPFGIEPGQHRISLHYVRTPNEATRTAMLDILLVPGTDVYRVKFGDTWYERNGAGGYRVSR